MKILLTLLAGLSIGSIHARDYFDDLFGDTDINRLADEIHQMNYNLEELNSRLDRQRISRQGISRGYESWLS